MLVNNREKNCAYYEGRPSKSDTKPEEKEWGILWKVQVPAKLKIFFSGD
jgi:hypothetical protein